jgi:hypothetical protein
MKIIIYGNNLRNVYGDRSQRRRGVPLIKPHLPSVELFLVLPVQQNQKSHILLFDGTNSKTHRKKRREEGELFETLKVNDSIRWVVDIIDQRNTPLKFLRSKLIKFCV